MKMPVPLAPLRCNWPCSAQHWHKGRQSSKDWSTLLQLLLAFLIWNSSPIVHHMPQSALHNLWHNPCTHALRSNCGQDIAPYIPNAIANRLDAPMKIVAGRSTTSPDMAAKPTSFACTRNVQPQVFAAVRHIK